MKQKYPHLLRVQNQNKPEVEVNLKENLKVTDKTHQKTKRQMNHIPMITPIIISIMIITLPQVRIEAADLLMVKVVANNSEASHSKAKARDLSIIHVNFRITDFREVHIRVTAINTVAIQLHNFTDTPDDKDVIPLNFLQHITPNYIEHSYSHFVENLYIHKTKASDTTPVK